MYPLKAVLVGTESALLELGNAIASVGVELEARFANLAMIRRGWPDPPPGPKLLVTLLGSEDDLVRFRQIADAFPGWPALVGIVGDYDSETLFRVNRAGASQMVPIPWAPDDLHAALDRIASQYGLAARPGKVISVFGVADESVAAFLAANLAYEAAEVWRMNTILAEPASSIGRLAQLLDLSPPQTCEDLYALGPPSRAAVQTAMAKVNDRLHVLVGPKYKFPAKPPDAPRVLTAVDVLKRTAGALVLALPSTFDDTCFELLARADDAILVATHQIPSLHALAQVRDALTSRPHVASVHMVVNRFDPDRPGLQAAHVREVLKTSELFTIAEDSQAYAAALDAGAPLRKVDSDCRALRDIDRLGEKLFGPIPSGDHERTLWNRWFGS